MEAGFGEGLNVGVRAGVGDRQIYLGGYYSHFHLVIYHRFLI